MFKPFPKTELNTKKSYQKYLLLASILAGLVLAVFIYISPEDTLPTPYNFQEPSFYDQPFLITASKHLLSIKPVNANAAGKVLDGDIIKYLDAYSQTDVVQTKSANKLKEDIILKQPGHPEKFQYQINLEIYDYEINKSGDIIFYPKGKKGDDLSRLFTIPAPFMVDAKGKKSSASEVEMSLADNGVLTIEPSQDWLAKAAYPVTLDPTIEINILNVYSHPQRGDNWEVSFTTQGQADLKIIPNDQATIDDDEFVSLWCGQEQRTPQILSGDIIFYPKWQCDDVAKVVHYTKKAGHHTLRFEFGGQIVFAHNDAASWLTGWSDRKSVTLSRPSGEVTNYQMKLLVGESAGAVGEDVDCGGICASDFDDLRFTTSGGTTTLDYWLDTATGTTPNQLATVWIEFDYIGTTSTAFYMYYGNGAAPAVSSGTSTFIVFDDFERGNNGDAVGGNWTVDTGAPTISTTTKYGGTRSGLVPANADLKLPVTSSNNIAIMWRLYKPDATLAYAAHGNGTHYLSVRVLSTESVDYYNGAGFVDLGVTIDKDSWQLLEVSDIVMGTSIDILANDIKIADNVTNHYDNAGYANYLRMQASYSSFYLDNVIVRNYRTIEPDWGSWENETPGWLSGWSFRKSVTLIRPSGTVVNYQMKILVGESPGTPGKNVDCGNKCAANFDDLRFTTSDGTTLLDYWIESITGTDPNRLATVWVEFDQIKRTFPSTFYMYYGNSTAAAVSNGTNTFIYFDDFERGNNGDAVGGSWTTLGGTAPVISTAQSYSGTRSCKMDVSTDMSAPCTASSDIAISWRFYKGQKQYINLTQGNGTNSIQVRAPDDEIVDYFNGAGYINTASTVSVDQWEKLEVSDIKFGTSLDIWLNGSRIVNDGSCPWVSSTYGNVLRFTSYWNGDIVYLDNVAVRSLMTIEPTWGSWGPEEGHIAQVNSPLSGRFIDSSLVGYWSFDGADMNWGSTTAEALDRSGYNNNGDVKSGIRPDIGINGQALSFDGVDDYLDVPDTNSLSVTENFTVSAWVYFHQLSIPKGESEYIILKKNLTDTPEWQEFSLIETNWSGIEVFSFSVYNSAGTGFSAFHESPTTITISPSTWYHLVGVKNGSDLKLYINNVVNLPENETEFSGSLWDSDSVLRIGADEPSSVRMDGLIDEVRIYNRALTPAEIAEQYQAGAARVKVNTPSPAPSGLSSGLVGNWTFNGQDMNWGSTTAEALDRSGFSNNGNVSGAKPDIGISGQALSFDGVDDYTENSSVTWDFTDNPTKSFSISAWFNPRSLVNLSGISLAGDSFYDLRLFCYTDSDPDVWGFQLKAGSTVAYGMTNLCQTNIWQHVVGVYDSSANKIYIYHNGSQADYETPADINTLTDTDGIRVGYAQNYFNGLIDEVRVYNRALSELEIQELYNLGATRKALIKQ